MNKFNLKNYPPKILMIIVCIIIAVNFFAKTLWEKYFQHDKDSVIEQCLIIVTSYGIVISALTIINKYVMWNWLLRLLRLADINGEYSGKMISSYQNESNANIELYCKFHILQNLNGFLVTGEFYNDGGYKNKSSTFISSSEELTKLEDGKFQIHYFYNNIGQQLNKSHEKYFLNNHSGVSVMVFNPINRTIEGYYFNHERTSYGTIALVPIYLT